MGLISNAALGAACCISGVLILQAMQLVSSGVPADPTLLILQLFKAAGIAWGVGASFGIAVSILRGRNQ